MELRVIAEALAIPVAFLTSEDPFNPVEGQDRQRGLTEALETIRRLVDRLQTEREGGSPSPGSSSGG
jgi:hypothetical protein